MYHLPVFFKVKIQSMHVLKVICLINPPQLPSEVCPFLTIASIKVNSAGQLDFYLNSFSFLITIHKYMYIIPKILKTVNNQKNSISANFFFDFGFLILVFFPRFCRLPAGNQLPGFIINSSLNLTELFDNQICPDSRFVQNFTLGRKNMENHVFYEKYYF